MSDWLTTAAVADWLGIEDDPQDQRLALCTDAAAAWAETNCAKNSYLVDTIRPDVLLGATQLAALFYQSRNVPTGLDSLTNMADVSTDYGNQISSIYRLLRYRRPVTG